MVSSGASLELPGHVARMDAWRRECPGPGSAECGAGDPEGARGIFENRSQGQMRFWYVVGNIWKYELWAVMAGGWLPISFQFR